MLIAAQTSTVPIGDDVLAEAFELGQVAAFCWDLAGDVVNWSPALYRLYGIAPDVTPDLDVLLARVHSADRAGLQAVKLRALARGGPFEHEFRLLMEDGALRWVLARGRVQQDSEGRTVRVIGVSIDVTKRKRAEAERDRLSEIVDNAGIGTWSYDIASGMVQLDACERRLLGLPGEDAVRRDDVEAMIHADDLPAVRAAAETACLAGGDWTAEFRVQYPGGSVRWLATRGRVLSDEAGDARYLVGINWDITERRAAQAQVKESEQRLKLALEAGGFVPWEFDIARQTSWWSHDLFALLGIAEPEARAMRPEEADAFVDTRDRARVRREFARAIRPGTLLRTEFRAARPDGAEQWLGCYGDVVRDEAGSGLRIIGVLHDITERKRAEERQSLLMRELDHRVKNMLATMRSIVSRTSAGKQSAAALQAALDGRIGALARAHTLLSQSRWEGASMRRIVEEELAPYGARGSGRVRIEGADLLITPKAAQAIAMSVHEMATNAAKYGALSRAEGRLDIAWGPIGGQAKAGPFRLRWVERGGPEVRPPERRGFGSVIVERMLAHELDAEVEVTYAPEGFRCEARIPRGTLLAEPKRESPQAPPFPPEAAS